MNSQRQSGMSPLFAAPYLGSSEPQPVDPYASFAGNTYIKLVPKTEEQQVQSILAKLEAAGIPFTAHDRDRRLVLHAAGRARVEYFPLKNRWREAGSNKRHHGTVEQFIAWFTERAGVTK